MLICLMALGSLVYLCSRRPQTSLGHQDPGPLVQWHQAFTTGAARTRVFSCMKENTKYLTSSYRGSLEGPPWVTVASGGWT